MHTPFIQPAAGLLVLALLMGGCASTPDDAVTELARAEYAIEAAKDVDAYQYARGSLQDAESSLRSAKQAADAGDAAQAARLATEAELMAQVAAARAERVKAEKALGDINESIAALQNEIERGADQ